MISVDALWDRQQIPANLIDRSPPARMGSSQGHTTKLKKSSCVGLTPCVEFLKKSLPAAARGGCMLSWKRRVLENSLPCLPTGLLKIIYSKTATQLGCHYMAHSECHTTSTVQPQ
jgi:hypothetical protein